MLPLGSTELTLPTLTPAIRTREFGFRVVAFSKRGVELVAAAGERNALGEAEVEADHEQDRHDQPDRHGAQAAVVAAEDALVGRRVLRVALQRAPGGFGGAGSSLSLNLAFCHGPLVAGRVADHDLVRDVWLVARLALARLCPGEAVFGYGLAWRKLLSGTSVTELAGAADGPFSLFGALRPVVTFCPADMTMNRCAVPTPSGLKPRWSCALRAKSVA